MQKRTFIPPAEKTHELPDPTPAFRSVLLLEDEGDFQDIVRSHLEINNYRVTCAANGVEGLKQVMNTDFDVILCDMMMPSLPGDMFYLAVERTKPHLCKRFIFMTGYKGDKKIDEFIRKVRGIMLWKPFQIHELLDTMKMIIETTQENG
jgi:CheY-like chemotaxis protein